MRIRFIFHILAILTVVLTFSMPFATLAQQKSVQTEISEATAEQDAYAVNLDAKAAAEQDASNDIHRFAWFSAGLGIAYIGCVLGVARNVIGETDSDDIGVFLFGTTASVLIPIISIYTSPVHVPAGRFTGKSPEYVDFYTDAYQRKMRRLQTKWAAAGVATGCGIPIILLLLNQSEVHP